MDQSKIKEGLTFDDVLLVPRHTDFLPNQADVSTRLTSKRKINIPIVSAAMDTITEAETAITMAQEGGIGILHKNLSIEKQVHEVIKVKKFESGIIRDPITISSDQPISNAIGLKRKYSISGIPVVDDGILVGIVTNRDLRFERNLEQKIADVMTTNLVTAPEGISQEDAKDLLHHHKIEKLLVVDSDNHLAGLITIKDLQRSKRFPNSSKDDHGSLIVGAAVGVGEPALERAAALLEAGCDLLVVDTAHGHSMGVLNTVKNIRKEFAEADIMAGNVATEEGCQALIDAGVNAVKVGIGPGSICTTRIVAGVGVPQVTAIFDCCKAANKKNIPVIADGGIKYSGEITKALAAGASAIMIGSLFAGTDESPGEIILYQGRSYKVYRGMGSLGAMKDGSKDRYFQEGVENISKLVPEGIEGRVPYRGKLSDVLYQLVGGLRSGMGYCGCKTIEKLQKDAQFLRVTSAGLRESHVHDVIITKGAPNYQLST
jgi:IMP dehydrogenase